MESVHSGHCLHVGTFSAADLDFAQMAFFQQTAPTQQEGQVGRAKGIGQCSGPGHVEDECWFVQRANCRW